MCTSFCHNILLPITAVRSTAVTVCIERGKMPHSSQNIACEQKEKEKEEEYGSDGKHAEQVGHKLK